MTVTDIITHKSKWLSSRKFFVQIMKKELRNITKNCAGTGKAFTYINKDLTGSRTIVCEKPNFSHLQGTDNLRDDSHLDLWGII